MTTFTLQDLTLPATAEQAVEQITKEKWMEHGMNNPISASAIEYATQHATTPQPSAELLHNPDLSTIINTICTQLQLLATVISQSKAQPEAGENSLQETVALVLQQSDWFKDMLREVVDNTFDIEDYAKDAVQGVVESEVESYFSNSFDPTDHFDFNDAVQDAVSDQIDDVVSDKMEDAVDAYLSGATISISK